jgi:hypothetical protein
MDLIHSELKEVFMPNYLPNSSTFLITRTRTLFEIIESVTIPQLLGSLIK